MDKAGKAFKKKYGYVDEDWNLYNNTNIMTDEQIEKDRQERVTKAKEEIEAILRKYELDVTAEDMIGQHTMIKIKVQFIDTKKHNAPLAQKHNPIVTEDNMKKAGQGKGDKI